MSRNIGAARILILELTLLTAGTLHAAPVLMSTDWAAQACEAWNADPVLTAELVEKWTKNDKGRGYKVIHIYRKDCPASPRVELKISEQAGSARCVYGGGVQNPEPDHDVDYLMWADTTRWQEMGEGKYGPMRAMMLFRLRFKGPYGEAMGHMTPFKSFLLLTGKVQSDASSCP